jgi:hypothetical protein
MNGAGSTMSPLKLGLAVWWPAFWTGMPIKIGIALLLLAAGAHPWEMPGLGFLLVLSIPVDIWAYGLAGRTVLLERLRTQPPEGLGLTLWWQATLLTVVYGGLGFSLVSLVKGIAKEGAAWVMEFLKALPVAEKISIELVLWSAPTTIVLIIVVLIGLSLFGRLVKRQVALGRPTSASYEALVREWDLSRVPADQPLLFTTVALVGVVLACLLWSFMPVTTPHVHELYKKPDVKVEPPFKPLDALNKTEKLLAKADESLKVLEAKAEADAKEQDKAKTKGGAKAPAAATAPAKAAAPAKAEAPKPR